MNKKQSERENNLQEEPSYEGIPSVRVPYNKDNQWWKRREQSLQQIASYGYQATRFR